MLSDRELLELAAKAASIKVIRSRLDDPLNMDFLVMDSFRNIAQLAGTWNPLTDDGDALRLAVKLKIQVKVFDKVASAVWEDASDWYPIEVKYTDSPYIATRLAIVRAAAEIGRAM